MGRITPDRPRPDAPEPQDAQRHSPKGASHKGAPASSRSPEPIQKRSAAIPPVPEPIHSNPRRNPAALLSNSLFTKGFAIALLAGGLAAISPAEAAPKKSAPKAPPAKTSTTKTKSAPSPEFLASRYQLDNIDAYVAARSKTFAIRTLGIDPFGLPQDPSKKPVAPKIAPKTYNKYKNIPPTPFADVVAALRVNAVMPHQQRFLIGSRSIRRGDKFPIVFRDKSITVQVLRVGGAKIDFLNTATGEKAALSLKSLPPGMNRESGGASPPGLVRNDPAAPVEVQLDPPASRASGALSRNR